jgi:hypothetical protein
MRERAQQHDAGIEINEHDEQVEEPSQRVRFVGGAIPPVQVAQNEDPRVVELKKKVTALVDRRFNGDHKRAFTHYDGDQDGKITRDEIIAMLSDAGVGNFATRGMWADGILDKIDMNHDRGVTWGEFETAFNATTT